MCIKYILLLFLVGTINAANLRDLAKRIYVGTCVNTVHLNHSEYVQMTGEQFNMATAEWEMKWVHVEPTQGVYTYELSDTIVAYAAKHKMNMRGHTLIWHEEVPAWVNNLNKTQLQKAIENRIQNEMTRYKGKIYAWDVVNEVFEENGKLRNSIFYQKLGESYISESFKIARKADPAAKLYINDYSIEYNNSKSAGIYNLVKKLKAEGVPIDGVGFQSHFQEGSVPSNFEDILKKFIALGVEIAITELDISSKGNEEQQAKDYANVFEICQKLSKCVGVTVWGWSDKYTNTPSAKPDMWDANLKPKAAVAAVQAVLKKYNK